MRLEKEYIHMCCQRETKVTQVTLDEEVIVPDRHPDLEQIVIKHGEVELGEAHPNGGRVAVKGHLAYKLLYRASDGSMQKLEGALPFDEMVNVAETAERDCWNVDWELEDLSIEKIHSRKVSVRAIVTLTLQARQLQDAEIAVRVLGDSKCDVMTRPETLTQIAVQTKETFRFREDVELEHNRPNITTILWDRLELRNWDVRPLDGRLQIRGDFALFVIYAGEDAHIPLQYVEKTLAFSEEIEVPDCTEEMIPDVSVRMSKCNLEAKADYDGELRAIGAEAILELDLSLYEEKTIEMLEDAYCPSKEIVLEKEWLQIETLLIKNVSRTKIAETILPEEERRVLQICHLDGMVNVDRVDAGVDHLVLEGALTAQMLYLEANDEAPFHTWRGALPFRIVVEAKGVTPQSRYRVKGTVEQLGAVMLGGGAVEVKAVIAVEVLAFHTRRLEGVAALDVRPFDQARLEALPGMCGYIVQPGDTLWKIAKECYTTVEQIREMNDLTTERVMPGDRLFVVKQVEKTVG